MTGLHNYSILTLNRVSSLVSTKAAYTVNMTDLLSSDKLIDSISATERICDLGKYRVLQFKATCTVMYWYGSFVWGNATHICLISAQPN